MDKQTEHYLLQQVELLTKRTNILLRNHNDFYNEWDHFMDDGFNTKLEGSLYDSNIQARIKEITD